MKRKDIHVNRGTVKRERVGKGKQGGYGSRGKQKSIMPPLRQFYNFTEQLAEFIDADIANRNYHF